jgi:hypothetical protein
MDGSASSLKSSMSDIAQQLAGKNTHRSLRNVDMGNT